MQEGPGGGLPEIILRLAEAKAAPASLPRVDLDNDLKLDCPSKAPSTLRYTQNDALEEYHPARDEYASKPRSFSGELLRMRKLTCFRRLSLTVVNRPLLVAQSLFAKKLRHAVARSLS